MSPEKAKAGLSENGRSIERIKVTLSKSAFFAG
jgi:hypothetical protein